MADKRRAIRTGQALGGFRILSKRDGFYKKVPAFGQETIQKWVRNHHLVVHSPNNNDTLKIRVLDLRDGLLKVVLKNKNSAVFCEGTV